MGAADKLEEMREDAPYITYGDNYFGDPTDGNYEKTLENATSLETYHNEEIISDKEKMFRWAKYTGGAGLGMSAGWIAFGMTREIDGKERHGGLKAYGCV